MVTAFRRVKPEKRWYRMIAGLDLATSTGWAVHDGRQVVASGTWDLKPPKGDDAHRFMVFRQLLLALIVEHDVTTIGYERVIGHFNGLAAELYGGLRSTLLIECNLYGIRLLPFTPQQVKRHATRKATANKTEMVAAAVKRWPDFSPTTDDEVDARWVADLTAATAQERAA